MNLKIQVLGKGLIPRGLGLAPRKTPFNADLTLINTLLNTPGLQLNYLNPDDGRLLPLTRQNAKRVWDKYKDQEYSPAAKPQGNAVPSTPHVPENINKVEPPAPVEVKNDLPKEDDPKPVEESKVEETKVEAPKPVDPPVTPSVPETPKVEEKVEEKPEENGEKTPAVQVSDPTVSAPAGAAPAPIRTMINDGQRHQNNNKKK